MQMHIHKRYTVELSHEEMLLVSKGLGCRLTEEEKEKAAQLDDEIATLRVREGEHDSVELSKLARNLAERQ
jgi:hypothetical protein